eukprot:gene15709-21263_t
MPTSTGRVKVEVDMIDHNGLRGIAAVWIVVFHCIIYSVLGGNWDFQGSTLMPLFFLLSGYSLAIGYHSRIDYANGSIHKADHDKLPIESPVENSGTVVEPYGNIENSNPIVGDDASQLKSIGEELNSSKPKSGITLFRFYYNRLIRVMPVYYIGFLFAIPVTLAGYCNSGSIVGNGWISTVIVNIIPVGTWLVVLGMPLDGPEWFVQTLIFYWLCFPFLLKHYKSYTDENLLYTIRTMYFIQMIWVIFFMLLLLIATGDASTALFFSTQFVLARLPVFIMGMCTGILSTRYASDPTTMPWFKSSNSYLPYSWFISCCSDIIEKNGFEKSHYEKVVFGQSIKLLVSTFTLSIICILVGSTIASKVLRNSFMLWLGELSLSLYIIHWPVIWYLIWAVAKGKTINFPSELSCDKNQDDYSACQDELDNYYSKTQLPGWGIVVVPPISLALATVLYYAVEEPIRIYFK